jgi:malic enzyme
VTGAYAFLLLALAVQADNDFATSEELVERSEEVEALLTNVKVILAGLEAYGVMWAGIEVMAGKLSLFKEMAEADQQARFELHWKLLVDYHTRLGVRLRR